MPLSLSLPLVLSVRAANPVPRRTHFEPTESDGELVRRVRRGDRWAEEALYRRHSRPVTRVVLRVLGRATDAEDVVQDAFVIAFDRMGNIRDDDAFGDWLLAIAVRQVYRRFRRLRLMRAIGLDRGDDDANLARHADPRAGPEARAALAEVWRLLQTLGAEDRVAWVLRRVEGEKIDRVASACGCSRATAKRRVARADQAIRKHVSYATSGDDDE